MDRTKEEWEKMYKKRQSLGAQGDRNVDLENQYMSSSSDDVSEDGAQEVYRNPESSGSEEYDDEYSG